MEWSEQHDIALMKEVRAQNPFKAKKKTSNRAQIWLLIAEALSGLRCKKKNKQTNKQTVSLAYLNLFEATHISIFGFKGGGS